MTATEGGGSLEGLNTVYGYGELILCEQEKQVEKWYDSAPCEIAKEKDFFTISMTKSKDCRVVKMRKKCIECKYNKGPVEVFWKLKSS